jgi:hypothetical protein
MVDSLTEYIKRNGPIHSYSMYDDIECVRCNEDEKASIYIGEVDKEKPEGLGILVDSLGDCILGKWSNGNLNEIIEDIDN